MLDKAIVQAWLDAYVAAWKSYDRQAIGALFSDDARYYYSPYHALIQGREAIIASWLKSPDERGRYDGHYEPVLIEGDRAMTNGRSSYFAADGKTLEKEWNNVFLLTFDDTGRCTEYREWYMPRRDLSES